MVPRLPGRGTHWHFGQNVVNSRMAASVHAFGHDIKMQLFSPDPFDPFPLVARRQQSPLPILIDERLVESICQLEDAEFNLPVGGQPFIPG